MVAMMKYLSKLVFVAVLFALSTAAFAACDFPDDRASDGSRCGKRSAYDRPGGKFKYGIQAEIERLQSETLAIRQRTEQARYLGSPEGGRDIASALLGINKEQALELENYGYTGENLPSWATKELVVKYFQALGVVRMAAINNTSDLSNIIEAIYITWGESYKIGIPRE